VTQIRHSVPPTERAFFGVGPVTVAIPERVMPGRALPVISSEDALSAEVLVVDPLLDFAPDEAGRWRIGDRDSGLVWGSGRDEDPPRAEEVAYLGRVRHQGRALLVVAGVHAIGSLGAEVAGRAPAPDPSCGWRATVLDSRALHLRRAAHHRE
jgi:hypothetical protein